MVDYSEARLITLLLIGKGVRFILFTMAVGRIIDNVAFIQERPNSHSIEFVTCSESYPERFSRLNNLFSIRKFCNVGKEKTKDGFLGFALK